MSTSLTTWQQVEKRVQQRIKNNKLRHARFFKLQGTEAKKAVIQNAVARLMAPDAVFPYALRKRINPRRVGNITLCNVEPMLWLAWLQVWRGRILSGEFFDESSDAIDKLVDRAVDAERGSYCAATADSGGPSDGKLDTQLSDNLSRLTEAGQAFATEPTREIEQQTQFDAEAASLEHRKRIEADELVTLREAIDAYGRERKLHSYKKKNQRRALNLILFEPNMLGKDIALKCRVSEATVSRIRADVEELADKILTIDPEDSGDAVEESPAAVPYDETLTQIADVLHSHAALDLAATFQAPDVDADLSEHGLASYAKNKSSSALMRDNWSGGRRRYSEYELVTGSRYGGSWGDPAKIAERDARKKHAHKFSDAQLRELREKGVAAGVAVNSFLEAIDAFIEKRAAESVDSLLGTAIRGPKPST